MHRISGRFAAFAVREAIAERPAQSKSNRVALTAARRSDIQSYSIIDDTRRNPARLRVWWRRWLLVNQCPADASGIRQPCERNGSNGSWSVNGQVSSL
jgi:hypothetical protein